MQKFFFVESAFARKKMSCRSRSLEFIDESFEMPVNYWVAKSREEDAFLVEVKDGTKFLIAYSARKKAVESLRRMGYKPEMFRFLCFRLKDLMKKFSRRYTGVVVYGCKKPLRMSLI